MQQLVEQGLYIKAVEERAYRNRTRVEFMCVAHNISEAYRLGRGNASKKGIKGQNSLI